MATKRKRRTGKNPGKEKVMWGVKRGDPDWKEVILSTQPDRFDEVKKLAARDGFHKFRIAEIDLSQPPDFSKAVTSRARKRKPRRASENPGKVQRDLIERFLRGSDAGHAGSLYIHGDTLYSYGPHFPVARLEGGTVYVVPKETAPSRTTSGHIGAVERMAEGMGFAVRHVHLAKGNPASENPPAYFVIEPSSSRVLDVVRAKATGPLAGMDAAHKRARRKAQEYADRSGSEVVVVVHPYVPRGFRKGSVVSPLFYHYGASSVLPTARNPVGIRRAPVGSYRQSRDISSLQSSPRTNAHDPRDWMGRTPKVHTVEWDKGRKWKRFNTFVEAEQFKAELERKGETGVRLRSGLWRRSDLRFNEPKRTPSDRKRGQKSLRGLVQVYRSKRTPVSPTKRLRNSGISFKVDFDHQNDTFSIWVAPAKKVQAERLVKGSKPRKAKASKPKKARKTSQRNAPKRTCANPCRNPSHRHKKKMAPSNLDTLLTPAEAKKARKFA